MTVYLEYINNLMNEPILEEPPSISTLQQGIKSFYVTEDYFADHKDATRDNFSPWTGTYVGSDNQLVRTATKIRIMCLKFSENIWYFCENKHKRNKVCSEFQLKVFINNHPIFDIHREILIILDINENIVAPIFFHYNSSEHATSTNSSKRLLPSMSRKLEEALAFRTTSQAKLYLNSLHLNVKNSQIVSKAKLVADHVKSGKGRKSPSDVNKLINLFATNNSRFLDIKPCAVEKNDKKGIILCQIVGFPIGIQHYCATLPNQNDYTEHLDEIRKLSSVSKDKSKLMLENILKSVSVSRTVPNIGSLLYIDTTFSLSSGEYVTLVMGSSEMFRNSKSKKNSSVLLCLMIHSSKEMRYHAQLAQYLDEQLAFYGKGKVLTGIIHDNEASFKPYSLGVMLGRAKNLRCDIHLIDNIKKLFDTNEKLDAQRLVTFLYGKTEKTNSGILLRKGVLQCLNEDRFRSKLDIISLEFKDNVKKWLNDHKSYLFDHHSLYAKLIAGQTMQFLTTNLLESKNGQLKQFITNPIPAHKVITIIGRIHEEELKERMNAILDNSDTYDTWFKISSCLWNSLSVVEKTHRLKEYGLQGLSFDSKFEKYPLYVIEGDGKTPVDKFLASVQVLNVFFDTRNKNLFFCMNLTEKIPVLVELVDNRLVCWDSICKKHKNFGSFLCCHCVAVLITLTDQHQLDVLKEFESSKEKKTIAQVQASYLRPLDGSKFTVRKGNQRSHENSERRVDILSNTLEFSDYQMVCSSSEDEDFSTIRKKQKIIDSDDDY